MAEYTSNLDTSTNVVNLRGEELPTAGAPKESLILMLEDMLEKAKEGTLVSFDGVGFLSNGNRAEARGPTHYNILEVIGALECLKITLMQEMEGF